MQQKKKESQKRNHQEVSRIFDYYYQLRKRNREEKTARHNRKGERIEIVEYFGGRRREIGRFFL